MPKRMRACSSKIFCASALLREHFFEELQGARIVGLAEPEHGLLSNFAIAVVLGDFDQFWDAFFSWQLAEGEYRLFFHFGVRIVVNRAGDRADGFLPGFLGEPEKCLAADMRACVVVRHSNHFVDGAGFVAYG